MRKESATTNVPDFATHYYLPEKGPFLSLSDLDDAALWEVIGELQALYRAGRTKRMFGRTYVHWRRATEARLRELFLASGGAPERPAPHYFVLGRSRWYEQLAQGTRAISIPLAALPDSATSFTYPDSFTAMALGPDFGQPYQPRPYHQRVYRLGELADVVSTYGLPEDTPDDDYEGYHQRPHEKYIEIQLWSDEPVRSFLRSG